MTSHRIKVDSIVEKVFAIAEYLFYPDQLIGARSIVLVHIFDFVFNLIF